MSRVDAFREQRPTQHHRDGIDQGDLHDGHAEHRKQMPQVATIDGEVPWNDEQDCEWDGNEEKVLVRVCPLPDRHIASIAEIHQHASEEHHQEVGGE